MDSSDQPMHITEPLCIESLTARQPFCAGVIVRCGDALLATLNTDGLPEGLADAAWRVGGVGGGQEAGETMTECAVREAREEVCADVSLLPASVTHFHDLDTGERRVIRCSDALPPFLLQRRRNATPDVPYRPGLPTGPFTYYGLFHAQLTTSDIQPGDDVVGLLWLPCALWPLLEHQPTLGDTLRHGARLIERAPLDRGRRLWLPPDESLAVVAALLTTADR